MKHIEHYRDYNICIVLFAVSLLSACAGTGTIIESPKVDLIGVELTSADFRSQTFLLSFDVTNPNPFPLPVKAVTYRVTFDDQKFAGGETQGSFTVPARGDDSFAISVDLDLLGSATQLTSLVRGGLSENVSYELRGSLAVDIPFVSPIPFSSSGVINMTQTAADQFD
jgi:LEA14-like dessication related protein